MRKEYKRIAMLTLTGILLGTMPASSALATEVEAEVSIEEAAAESVFEDTEETTDTEEKDTKKEAKEDTKEDTKKETKKENKKKENKKKESVNYKPEIITITKSNFVADSLNGVDALYRKGSNDGSNSTYSCAAYIKRYYKEIHGVTVMNLFGGRTPSSSEGKFKVVKKPKVGDIVACSSTGGSNHWAIVKQVNDDNTVTLIEQNWKWSQGGQTVCKINRSISISSGTFYRLYK